jgi:DNA polymerase III epsilon subunit-like protein
MIVLDVETTGPIPGKYSLVSIGAVDFSKPESTFYEECQIWDGAHVAPEALAVNGFTEEQIRDSQKKTEAQIVTEFLAWLDKTDDHTIAGQNPFFDYEFVVAGAERASINYSLARRIIDLHSITYFHMVRRGISPLLRNKRTNLNSDTIMEYVGIPTEPKPHIALNGAVFEAEAFSRLMHEKSLFPQFAGYPIPWLSK